MIEKLLGGIAGASAPMETVWIWSWLVKGSLFLAVLFVLAALLRRAPSSARHLLWTAGLVIALTVPITSVGLPDWHIDMPGALSRIVQADVAPAARSPEEVAREGMGVAGAPEGALSGAADSDVASETGGAVVLTGSGGEPVTGFGGETLPGTDATAPAASALPWTAAQVLGVLLALWFAVAALLLLRLGASMLRTRRLVSRAQALQDPTWNRALLEISDRLDLVRTPKLVVSRAVSLPMTCGTLQPAVVLPSGSSEWSADRRDAVLCHELAHIRRRDLLSHLLGHAACALYWFNPMAWRAARRLRAESERSCDDLVLSLGTRASAYADHLLQIATAGHASVAPAAALPMAQPKEFEARLLSILAPGMRRTTLPLWQGSALVALVLLCAAPLIALSPRSTLDAAAEGAGAAGIVDGADPAGIVDGAGPADPAFLDGLGSESHAVPPTGVTPPSASASSAAASPSPSAAALADEDQDLDGALDREATELDASARRLAAGVLDLVSASLGDAWPAILDGAQNPSPEARAALTAALRDPDGEVRRLSAWALGSQSDSAAVRALTAALAGDPDAEVREMSAWALAQQGRRFVDASAVDALSLAVVQDEAADVRSMAAWALGSLEPDGAESALERALATDADQSVRSMSAWALGQIGADSSKEALAAALGSGEARVKEQAAWALGQIGSGPAPASLIAALGDESAQVREVTAWALGRIEDPAAVPGLVQAVADPEGGVRSAALWALSQMDREPQAIAALTAALQDPSEEVRRAAARALGGAGGGAWPWPRPMPRPRPTP